jgi:hypothetical protein
MQQYSVLGMLGFLLFCCTTSCTTSHSGYVEGIYNSISESEWAITVKLNTNGSSEIQFEQWDAGKFNERSVKTEKGTWSINGNKISLKYNQIVDTLIYSDNVSLTELGLKGGAPGLIQVPPIDKRSIIHGVKLWKKPHKFYSE